MTKSLSSSDEGHGPAEMPGHVDRFGSKRWYNEAGQLHREDGPAVEYYDGAKYWYVNGLIHREDGPAAEWADGAKMFWLFGEEILKEKFTPQLILQLKLTKIIET